MKKLPRHKGSLVRLEDFSSDLLHMPAQEHSSEAELVSLPSSSAPELLLPKTASLLPAQSLLSPRSSFFSQVRLHNLLSSRITVVWWHHGLLGI